MRSLALFSLALAGFSQAVAAVGQCKCFPGDACWPSLDKWSQLNKTVDGRLIATVPLGKPCHRCSYNETTCDTLKDEWLYTEVHYDTSSSVMAPIFANASCDPWQPIDRPCLLGNYVSYAVNVSTVAHVQATLAFAKANNVRLVIRNTGHDYLGRSTGAGGLAVWTHNLKDIDVIQYSDSFYSGPALRMGAGIQGFEALAAASDAGYVSITGECPTVGIAGGYTQGGGHSALSTSFGLGADNALSFDVVLPNGTFITATRESHKDVYWALAGGGPGNYGVVMSVTSKVHPDATISGAKFAIYSSNNDDIKKYTNAFHAALSDIVEAGSMVIYYFGSGFLSVPAMTMYNKTQADVEAALKPLLDSFADLGVTVTPTYTTFSSYYEHYDHYWGPLPKGNIEVGASLFGGRLITAAQTANFSETSSTLIDLGVTLIGVGLDVSKFGTNNANGILPAWRTALVHASLTMPYNFTAPFQDMLDLQSYITNTIQPIVENATPGSGAYMNEANYQQKDFQDAFYGNKYPQLLSIKKALDPEGLLYTPTAVGSEQWTVANDGRMCRA